MPRLALQVTRLSDVFRVAAKWIRSAVDRYFYVAISLCRFLTRTEKQRKTVVWITGILLSALIFCHIFSRDVVSSESPHPGVVCVIAWEPESPSRGSGSLIGKKTPYGFVITNWHVIRDSTGLVMIRYADGTAAKGVVVSVDSLWDLALIATIAPQAEPIRIASTPPRKGDPLWLAGYGADDTYKMAGGYCTQYASPSISHKNEKELLEFSAVARLGDSGGPIFNQQSELAGVLFGTNSKVTLGSYCGRILKFIDQSAPFVLALPKDPEELFTLAQAERRTILQRNTVSRPGISNASLPVAAQTEMRTVENYSSSSSFGGGRSKRKVANAKPVADPFMSVESIQPNLGFLGFDYQKEKNATDQNAQTIAALPVSVSMQNAQNVSSATSSGESYSNLRPVQNHSAVSASSSPETTTPAREIPGSTGNATSSSYSSGSSATAMPPYSTPATTSSAYSSNGTDPGVGRYGQTGTTATSGSSSNSYGSGEYLPPVTPSPYAPTSSPYSGSGTPATDYGGYSSERNRQSGYENRSDRASDHYHGSYSKTSAPSSAERYSSYEKDLETELQESDVYEKYASSSTISAVGDSAKPMTASRNAIKIIAAVIVIFFVLFHAVKLMSIIEEQ